MRPQYHRRAVRALAAPGAAVLAVAACTGAADAATLPASPAALGASAAPAATAAAAVPVAASGGFLAAPIAVAERASRDAFAALARSGAATAPIARAARTVAHRGTASVPIAHAARTAARRGTATVPIAHAARTAARRGTATAPIAHAARTAARRGTATAPIAHAARTAARRPHVRRAPRRLHVRARMLHPDVLVGQDVAFIGVTLPQAARRLVGVQRQAGTRWVDVARARTDRRGRFLARYWPRVLGRIRLRLRVAAAKGRAATVLEPVATVFHEVVASWYGPGGTTACGEALGAATLGVANRTLPCGTMVTLRYRGRTLRVPVIDRGPYVAGRDYDLTYATKLALGAGDVTVIWASA